MLLLYKNIIFYIFNDYILTSLFFIGSYCLYYNTHSDGLIELKYDDLYHYQRKEKAYVVYFITLDFFPINIDQIFINRVKKIVEKFKVCKLEKTIYDNKLKYTSKTENILIEALTLKGIIPKNNIELILKTHQSDHLISFILDKKNKQFSGKVGENIFVNMGVKNKGLIQYLEKYNWNRI